jgi:hypothetical protein
MSAQLLALEDLSPPQAGTHHDVCAIRNGLSMTDWNGNIQMHIPTVILSVPELLLL